MSKLRIPKPKAAKRAGGKRTKPAPASGRTTTPTAGEIAARVAVAKAMFNPVADAAAAAAFQARRQPQRNAS